MLILILAAFMYLTEALLRAAYGDRISDFAANRDWPGYLELTLKISLTVFAVWIIAFIAGFALRLRNNITLPAGIIYILYYWVYAVFTALFANPDEGIVISRKVLYITAMGTLLSLLVAIPLTLFLTRLGLYLRKLIFPKDPVYG